MNLVPALCSVLEELTQRFDAQIARIPAPAPNELYLDAPPGLAGALCSVFYKKHAAGSPACLPRTSAPPTEPISSTTSTPSTRAMPSSWCV